MSTTTIKFTMKDLDGTVVPYTQFQVASGRLNTGEVPDVMPATTSFTTDANGQASVVLTVTEAPYYLSKLDGSTDKVVAYKFFVPASDVTLEAELLYVDLGRTSKFYNDKSVAALIEAKVTAVNAANRALQVVTTLGSLDTLRTNLGSIISVGTAIAAVNTVATNIASVNAVNAASTTISAVNAALTNINAVGSSIASVNTVASNIGNVSTVVGMSANIASVVANATDIDTVANNMADVQAAADALPGLTAATTIAPYITQLTDVASNITTISAVGNNIENINDVAGMEADIEALADNLANLALAAAAVTQAVDAQKQLFTVGVDYSYGISTALALTYVPAKANAVKVFFDGEYQTKDSFTVVHHTITFNSPIVASKVEVQYDVPSSFVGLTPSDLVTLQTAETNASNSASASAVSAAASLASEIDAQQSASAAAVSASSMQQAEDGVKELFVAGIDYTANTSTTITLDAVPAKSNSVLVFFDGVYKHTSSWNRVGTSIIFNAPITAALVEVWYQVPSLLVALTPADQAILDAAMLAAANSVTAADASADAAALSETAAEAAAATVSAAVDGVKDLYVAGTHYTKNVSTSVTLSAAPNKPNTVKVFFNGVYQNKDTYYLVGSTINFGIVGTPDVIDVDSIEVQYEIPSQFVGLSAADQAVLTAAVSSATSSANTAVANATASINVATALSAPGGSALVGHLASGTGAVARTVQSKLRESISPEDFGAVGDLLPADDTPIANMRVAQRADQRWYKTTHNSYNVFFKNYDEFKQPIAGVAGRYAPKSVRVRVVGDGVYTPNSGGVSSSSNPSAYEVSGAMYTAGNFEIFHTVANNYGVGPMANSIADLTGYGATVFASETALRNGSSAPTGLIGSIGSRTLTVTGANLPFFGAGVSNRSGVYRGRALLNDTLKQAVTATLNNTTRVVTLSAAPTNAVQVGDYFGFDGDTHNTVCRHLARIITINSATEFVLDDTPEGERTAGAAQYQGVSTTGAASVFPAMIATGYDPDTGVFTFLDPAPDIDSRFLVGHTVVQHPNTDITLIGHQVDLARTAGQRVPLDIGFVVANDGQKAFAGFYASGGGSPTVKYTHGVFLRNCENGLTLDNFPVGPTIQAQGMKVVQRNQSPSVWGGSSIQGDLFLRNGGSRSKIGYLHDGVAWNPIATVSETATSAAAMPTVDVPGWGVFVSQFDYSVEWSVGNNRWQFMGLRCIGTAAQKPSTVKPIAFKYYETDTGLTKTWDGSIWV